MSGTNYSNAFRECLLNLDVKLMRKLWRHVSPHLPQPSTDDETLHSMHLARISMKTLPEELVVYSERWLQERKTGRVAAAVGISIIAPKRRRAQAEYTRAAMSDAVLCAVREGVDLETEAHEIKRRMNIARQKA